MPKFVEVVYETGRSSVMQVESEEEALSAMAEQHRRAKHGELAGPQGGPAERVAKAFIYDRHPNDYNPSDTLTADELKALMPDMIDSMADDNGIVSVGHLAQQVRALSHPMKLQREAHESMFRMEEIGEISPEQVESASEGELPEPPANGGEE